MSTPVDIFGRLFFSPSFRESPEGARAILALDFPAEDRDRMNHLSEMARNGTLSKADDDELEAYILVGNLLGIMQTKARPALKRVPKKKQLYG